MSIWRFTAKPPWVTHSLRVQPHTRLLLHSAPNSSKYARPAASGDFQVADLGPKSRLFRPTLIPFCEHRDLVHCSASDDVQRLLIGTREGQVVGIPRYGNGAQVLALWAEDLDARRRCRIDSVLAVDREAVPPKSNIGRPVRPLGHDFILGEVAPILHSPVGLDVEGQDVLTTFLGKVSN